MPAGDPTRKDGPAMSRLPLRHYWALLATYLRPQRPRALLLALLIFGSIGLQLVNPQIIRYFIDSATTSAPDVNLLYAGLLFLGMALVLQVVNVASTYVGEDVGWRATNLLRADLALHSLQLDMSFHNERTPGEMIERIDGDVANLAIFFAHFAIRVLGSLLLLIGVLLVLLREDWRISLALTIYTLIALAALALLRTIAVPHWKATREASADLFGFLEEQLAGTEDVRSSGATGFVMRHLFQFNRVRLQKELKAGTMNTMMVALWFSLFTIGQIIAFVSGYALFVEGLLTIGTVYLIVYYTDAIFRPLREITNEIQNLQKAIASIERIQELYVKPSAIRDGPAAPLPAGPLSVAFERVTFTYPDARADATSLTDAARAGNGAAPADQRVLEGLSFELAPGHVLGLLGRTGSGKTTVTRLLFRLYDPDEGAIRLSDIDLRDLRVDDLRSKVGIVTQDVQLFRASVRDNLTFFDQGAISDARILQVLDELGLMPWFRSLPHGLDTELESGGKGLSAGEAQLLAFTRVFLRDPGLVILDEASSRLDPATEQLIERAIDKLLENRSCIIIAHRLATVHRADSIVILEDGRICEYGAYDALVSNPDSRFARLLRTGLEEVLA